jgi:hypothetical protein
MACEHGREAENGIPKGGWAGGVGTCGCCGSTFVWINAGRHNMKTGAGWTRTWLPQDRCGPCGGKYVEEDTPPRSAKQ